ncbi:hypothetical protein B0H10DRAFT_2237053 [Mycena sp. CBHHK59/15]|nr:hypothetical protein B0H10DRAFT_2237053 [Mycena sp. CBHHK59/15]
MQPARTRHVQPHCRKPRLARQEPVDDPRPLRSALDVWFDGMYHSTNVSGASFSFDFEVAFTAPLKRFGTEHTLRSAGSAFYLWGAAGLAFESCIQGAYRESHESRRETAGEGHTMLVDFLKTTVELAPAGAPLMNSTLWKTDLRLVYTGNWTVCYLPSGPRRENVCNPLFSGGYSRYTNGDSASISLSFNGAPLSSPFPPFPSSAPPSASLPHLPPPPFPTSLPHRPCPTCTTLFIFGDKTDRHGLYTVVLDTRPPVTLNGVSGCGGSFAHACEKENTPAFFAANLDESEHTVTVTNVPGALGAYFERARSRAGYYYTQIWTRSCTRRRRATSPRGGKRRSWSVHALLLLFIVGLLLACPFRR